MAFCPLKTPPAFNILLGFLLIICGGGFLSTTAKYIDVSLYTRTTCYPNNYGTEIRICYDASQGLLHETGPYPVTAWIEFIYFNPAVNSTQNITYRHLVCGYDLQKALLDAKAKYPYMKAIPCGIKSWMYWPVEFMPNGYPWNQWELMVAFGATFVVLLLILIVPNIYMTCKQKRKYLPV